MVKVKGDDYRDGDRDSSGNHYNDYSDDDNSNDHSDDDNSDLYSGDINKYLKTRRPPTHLWSAEPP